MRAKVQHSIAIRHHPTKRLFDILFSLTALAMALPLFLLIALGIKCTSKGRVFYSQKRMGRGGRIFTCYKFRTMVDQADEKLSEILIKDPELAREWALMHKLREDPRVTRFGQFLRRTSLDELPQFWNVLRGDLSVVGPRPIVEEEVQKFFGEKAALIWQIRPGLTGLWQISGRSDIKDYQKRVSLEEFYVKSRSFWLDLKIIAKTVAIVFFPRGAY